MAERFILVTDAKEVAAVTGGIIKGEAYTDGEVYAEAEALFLFRRVADSSLKQADENTTNLQRKISRDAADGKR